jgi:hypothetical protein
MPLSGAVMANGEERVVILAAKGNARPDASLSVNLAPVQEGTRSGEIVVRPSRLHGLRWECVEANGRNGFKCMRGANQPDLWLREYQLDIDTSIEPRDPRSKTFDHLQERKAFAH